MGETHNNSSQPEGKKGSCGIACFLLGMVVAMLWGWYSYPNIMYDKQEQPIVFNHVIHMDVGMDCADCHYLREDGTFAGRPTTESCASCHEMALTDHPEEIKFIKEYVETGREIADEWLIYAKQPDNVYFPHAPHSFENCARCHEYMDVFPISTVEESCAACHIDVWNMETPPTYQRNWLSSYSRDIMMMWECEACHAIPGHMYGGANASNACFVCHK